MDDIKNLQQAYLNAVADLRASDTIHNLLREENAHLREVISTLLSTISSFSKNN